MSCPSSQLNTAESLTAVESALLFGHRLKRLDTPLLIETALVTIAAILAIRLLAVSSISNDAWFVNPGILVAAALIPTAIKRGKFAEMGFSVKQIGPTLLILCRICVIIFSVLFVGLWLLKSCRLALPLRPVPPQGQGWVSWLLYQFMYVAVAEEVFFRGYVQTNILRLTNASKSGQCYLWKWISIAGSAACFSVAHIIVQGNVLLVLTFLPGLILGWLFIRTRSLLAPILFHGLANACYCLMAALI